MLQLPRRPTRVPHETSNFDRGIVGLQILGLFHVYAEIKLERARRSEPFPSRYDKFLLLYGSSFINRGVPKRFADERRVEIGQLTPHGPIQNNPQSTLLLGVRRKKNDRLYEIRIKERRV